MRQQVECQIVVVTGRRLGVQWQGMVAGILVVGLQQTLRAMESRRRGRVIRGRRALKGAVCP